MANDRERLIRHACRGRMIGPVFSAAAGAMKHRRWSTTYDHCDGAVRQGGVADYVRSRLAPTTEIDQDKIKKLRLHIVHRSGAAPQ